MPKVSVVITTYNDAKYIPEALAHLEKQTFQDFEVIIVDDGSTDEASIAILKQLPSNKVKVLHKENGHLSSARNFGVRAAAISASYILFHDADDYFESSYLEKAVQIMERSGIDTLAVTCFVTAFEAQKFRWEPRGGTVENFLFENECCGNSLVRKSAYETAGGSDEQMRQGFEDWELWIRLLKNGGKIMVIPEYLFHYRIRQDSMTRSVALKRREDTFRYIMTKHADLYLNYLPKYYAAYDISRLSTLPLKRLLKLVYKNIFK